MPIVHIARSCRKEIRTHAHCMRLNTTCKNSYRLHYCFLLVFNTTNNVNVCKLLIWVMTLCSAVSIGGLTMCFISFVFLHQPEFLQNLLAFFICLQKLFLCDMEAGICNTGNEKSALCYTLYFSHFCTIFL